MFAFILIFSDRQCIPRMSEVLFEIMKITRSPRTLFSFLLIHTFAYLLLLPEQVFFYHGKEIDVYDLKSYSDLPKPNQTGGKNLIVLLLTLDFAYFHTF